MALTIDFGAGDLTGTKAEVLAIVLNEGPFEKQRAFAVLDARLDGALAAQVQYADFRGRTDQVLDVAPLGRLPAKRIVLVGAGPKRGFSGARLRRAAAVATRAAISATSLALVVGEHADGAAAVRLVAEGIGLGAYTFTKYRTGERVPKRTLGSVVIHRARERAGAAERRALEQGLAVARAVNVARDAVNEPPNVLTPAALAEAARRVAKEGRLQLTVLDEKGIRKAKMHLLAAVGQGSANPPRFVHLSYVPKRAKSKIVFVGKGVTFDSGGLSIKPAANMEIMKSDMGGAAAVLGVLSAVAALRPNVEVHGIIAAAENMPDANAYRPADVYSSLDGKTVEIINTDAEGRLVLADALAYGKALEPDLLVDAGTLTEACVIALGTSCAAFYTADDRLAKRFESAASAAGERFWRLPLLDELREQLNSDVADLKHATENRFGGSITAALFLREFVGSVPWIHCDMPGPAFAMGPRGIHPKGGTGHAVLTFLSLVEESAG
jgi:leucyl aminopeptidase